MPDMENSGAALPELPPFETPIALLVFNRPDTTKKVLETIARLRPRTLLVVGDGARASRPGELALVMQVRDLVAASVTWPCEFKTDYSDTNLGCKRRVASGITWVFEQVDRAIILEDDCVPVPDFFPYCTSLLEKYEQDQSVFAVAGSNFTGENNQVGYYKSDFSLMWGWATWRDRWAMYRIDASDFRSVIIRKWWRQPYAMLYWLNALWRVSRGKVDTWDYQWLLTVWRHKAKCLRPTANLTRNIGYGPGATHTTSANNWFDFATPINQGLAYAAAIAPRDFVKRSEKMDQSRWAMISLKSVLLLYFPVLQRFRRNPGT